MLIFLWLLMVIPGDAQITGFQFPKGKEKVELPFYYRNGFIVVKMQFNGMIPVQLIFDTGAEYTILTQKEFAEILGVKYSREYTIMGSDMKTQLTAYLARGVSFHHENIVAENQDIFVLEEDYFQFEAHVGDDIQGIIGASFFKNLIVEINYQKQRLYFYTAKGFSKKNTSSYSRIPITVTKGKPYFTTQLQIIPKQELPVKLLLDTGASLGLLLHTDSSSILQTPEHVTPGKVASGLGGEIMGYLGRVHYLDLKDYHFDHLVTSFQDLTDQQDTTLLNGRNGLIGNRCLERFSVIIDYVNRDLWLKSNRHYYKKFKFNKTGLSVIATGQTLNDFIIQSIMPGSSADLAGLKVGDQILSINRRNSLFLNLSSINNKFQKKDGKVIRLKVLRNGEKKVFYIKLKQLI